MLLTFDCEEGGGLHAAQVQSVLSRVLHTRLVDDQGIGVSIVLELVLVAGETLLQWSTGRGQGDVRITSIYTSQITRKWQKVCQETDAVPKDAVPTGAVQCQQWWTCVALRVIVLPS